MVGLLAFTIDVYAAEVSTRIIGWGVALTISGFVIALYGDQHFDAFSPLFVIGMIFSITYGLVAILLPVVGNSGVIEDSYPKAGLVSFLSIISLFFGYQLKANLGCASTGRHIEWYGSRQAVTRFWIVILGLVFIGVSLQLYTNNFFISMIGDDQDRKIKVGGIIGVLSQFGIVAVSMTTTMAFFRKSKKWKVAAAAIFFVLIVVGVLAGKKLQILIPFLALAIAWNYGRGRLSRKTIISLFVGGIILIGILGGVISSQRTIMSQYSEDERSVGLSVAAFGSVISDMFTKEDGSLLFTGINYGVSRLSHISVVESILRYQSKGGDLKYGDTYARTMLVVVPRVLWKDKPPVVIGQEIAVELGYRPEEMTYMGKSASFTSIGITLVGEWIYNFPWWTAPLGMIVLGLFYRYLYELFLKHYSNNPEVVVGLYAVCWITLYLKGSESNFALSVGGLFQVTAFIVVLLFLTGFKVRIKGGFYKKSAL